MNPGNPGKMASTRGLGRPATLQNLKSKLRDPPSLAASVLYFLVVLVIMIIAKK
jgi:hypothetical protein